MSEATIYTKPGCPYCAAAKDDLQRRGVRYTEHNVQADPDALRAMLARNGGQRQVPTLVEDGRVTVGFGGT
jgi:glutaredoxin